MTGSFKDIHLAATSADVRLLSPDVALVHVTTKSTENAGGGERTSFPLFGLTKRQKEWLIAAVQNTLTSGLLLRPLVLLSDGGSFFMAL